MKYLLILAFACISLSSTAQVIDTTMTGNAMHMNLNLGKLDSTIRSLQEIVEAQQATIDSLEAGSSFDGDYNSLSNLPTIPSKTSDLTNDAGFTTFDGDYNSLSNEPSMAWLNLNGAYLSYADLSNANFRNADLSNADLSVAYLHNANLSGADLSDADLEWASLQYANLWEANLNNANLTYANLSDANLDNANLRYANLTNANLSRADLLFANLRYANLTNANLSDANLSLVIWTGAYILGCTGCTCRCGQ